MRRKLLFLLLFGLVSCSFSKNEFKLAIIELKSSGMGVGQEGEVVSIESHARVIFKDDFEIYIAPVNRTYYDIGENHKGEFTNDKLNKADTVHRVFVKRKNQQKGIEYFLEAIDSVPGQPFQADSLWSTLQFYNKSIANFSIDIGKPIQIIENESRKIARYVMPHQIGQADTIIRYYDKSMKNVPYSFSEKLDKENDSKLYRIFAIANEISKGDAMPDHAIPRREFNFEMKISPEKNINKYLHIIEKFVADSKRLHLE